MARLIFFFVFIPVLELFLLIEIGKWVGILPTLALIVLTGVVGAALARQQGLGILQRLRVEVGEGVLPGEALVDGALVLMAGAVLLTPGVLTDFLGFLCLIPASRRVIRGWLERWLGSLTKRGSMNFSVFSQGPAAAPPSEGMKNVTPSDSGTAKEDP